jgi:hypothetical protein
LKHALQRVIARGRDRTEMPNHAAGEERAGLSLGSPT